MSYIILHCITFTLQILLAAGCIDSEKVHEVITSRNIQAPSPRAGLLDEIALALDGTSPVLANWYNLAIKLGVPREACWEFERCSTQNPTNQLFQHLETTRPLMTLKELKEALKSTERKDLLETLENQNMEGMFNAQKSTTATLLPYVAIYN